LSVTFKVKNTGNVPDNGYGSNGDDSDGENNVGNVKETIKIKVSPTTVKINEIFDYTHISGEAPKTSTCGL